MEIGHVYRYQSNLCPHYQCNGHLVESTTTTLARCLECHTEFINDDSHEHHCKYTYVVNEMTEDTIHLKKTLRVY